MKESLWKRMIDYINSKSIGEVLTRKDLIDTLGNPRKKKFTTIDNYRLLLSHCEILSYMSHGKYTLKNHINEDITASEIKRIAHHGTWLERFYVTKAGQI